MASEEENEVKNTTIIELDSLDVVDTTTTKAHHPPPPPPTTVGKDAMDVDDSSSLRKSPDTTMDAASSSIQTTEEGKDPSPLPCTTAKEDDPSADDGKHEATTATTEKEATLLLPTKDNIMDTSSSPAEQEDSDPLPPHSPLEDSQQTAIATKKDADDDDTQQQQQQQQQHEKRMQESYWDEEIPFDVVTATRIPDPPRLLSLRVRWPAWHVQKKRKTVHYNNNSSSRGWYGEEKETPQRLIPFLAPLDREKRVMDSSSSSLQTTNTTIIPARALNKEKLLQVVDIHKELAVLRPQPRRRNRMVLLDDHSYQVEIPVTPEGTLLRIKIFQGRPCFFGYHKTAQGKGGLAEQLQLIRQKYDVLCEIDGVPVQDKPISFIQRLFTVLPGKTSWTVRLKPFSLNPSAKSLSSAKPSPAAAAAAGVQQRSPKPKAAELVVVDSEPEDDLEVDEHAVNNDEVEALVNDDDDDEEDDSDEDDEEGFEKGDDDDEPPEKGDGESSVADDDSDFVLDNEKMELDDENLSLGDATGNLKNQNAKAPAKSSFGVPLHGKMQGGGVQPQNHVVNGKIKPTDYYVRLPVYPGGLYIKVWEQQNRLVFFGMTPLPNGEMHPAAKSFRGLGDLIVAIDGQSVENMDAQATIGLLQQHNGRRERILQLRHNWLLPY